MSAHSWQHFRDEAARENEKNILAQCVSLLRLDTVGYMLGLGGYEYEELLGVISDSDGDEDVRLLRDILATCQYLCQFEPAFVVRNWFIGIHPSYDERSPIDIFRDRQAHIILDHLRAGGRLFALSV